jgi:integrase
MAAKHSPRAVPGRHYESWTAREEPALARRSANDELIPTNLTPHSLRRTFASLLFAVGESPVHVMAQMGHTSASLTLGIDARQLDRSDGEPERLRALVNGEDWTAFRRGSGGQEASAMVETPATS